MQTSIELRPFYSVVIPKWYYFYKKINYLWWLQRMPMFTLAIPAAYGVAAFSSIDSKLPDIIATIAGMAFESTYIGTIALGDQMTSDDKVGRRIWFGLNIAAVFASALFSTLYFSGGHYAGITPESITHGALLPIINFFYGFLLHWISSQANEERKHNDQLTQIHCEYCNIGKPNKQSVYSHYRSCDAKLAGKPKRFMMDGTPLT